MPKKVLFVITKSVWGGAQRYVFDLATSLPKEKFEVVVAAGGNGPLLEKLHENSIRTIPIKSLERNVNFAKEIASMRSLYKIFKDEEPDIIHLNSTKTGGIGALAALIYKLSARLPGKQFKKRELKTIFTVHGWAFNEDRSFIKKIVIFFAQWFTALLCDRIVIISRQDYRQALKMPLVKSAKFSLVPLGIKIDKNNFLTKTQALKFVSEKAGAKFLKGRFCVGTICELTNNKGIRYLIEAIKGLKNSFSNLKCVIIGEGENYDILKNSIRSMDLENTVYLLGFLPDASKYIKAFDAFVLSSTKEGLPYVILEAMSAGVPVVATAVGGLTDLIEHEKNGYLISPKNSEKLALAIKTLIENGAARKDFGQNLQKKVGEKFAFDKMLGETIKLYS